MKFFLFLLFVLFFILLCHETEGKGGRGGGGRGSFGRGGSRGGGYKGSSGGRSSVVGGRTVVGTYKTFGSSNRWSIRGGRSFYFIGFPFGHSHYGRTSYKNYDGEEDDTGLMNPWVIMILVLLGINSVGFVSWLGIKCYVNH